MPSGIDRTDRTILIFAGVILLGLAIATGLLNRSNQQGRAEFPSTYSTNWDGAKAAYLLLEKMGYAVRRWNEPPTALGSKSRNQVLILANPMQTPTPEEKAALRVFLENGGEIIATGGSVAWLLPEGQYFMEEFGAQETSFPALIPSPLTSGANEISMIPPLDWHPSSAKQVVIYGNEETAAVIAYAVGKGRVVWWGSPSPLTNRGIRNPANLALFLNSVGDSGKRILWDEYFHGARQGLSSYFWSSPLPWASAQLGLVFLFMLVTFSRRYGTIRMPGKFSRLSPLEFVDTLGGLYARAHAASAAVRVSYHRFRYQFSRQLGLPATASPAEMARAASLTLGWKEAPVVGGLLRADRGSRTIDLNDAEALEIIQELHDYSSRLEAPRTR
jgi:hypothetical protein